MSIYEHFRKEERTFIDHVLEWKQQVEYSYTSKLTDFLDPREQYIVRSLVGGNDEINVSFFGGHDTSERKRALLVPAYVEPMEDDFSLLLLEVKYASKFHTITHPQLLGALMGIGLKRQKYGDIIISNDAVQLVVSKEVASFVEMNVTSVGRAKVAIESIPFSTIHTVKEVWQEGRGTITSFRLDVVLAEIFHLSRQKVQMLIKGGAVKVNHKIVEQPSFECGEDDLFSVRGYGRCKMLSIEGQTKRDKWKITYGLQKN
ncbi:RNA-binding protein [Priestia taiwanensis]|uniref:RNA-binding protein S4 n=1 Tax=Priestia taiwanensis TaxID=1347902 RepID=A0A917AQ42_9BACI|nr:RNA-binding protein [Priestia taiwanensis]MBM7362922.1 RNA-binding protein YlmH [Priestia taiwanensis]GGE66187.1 RNA-binding protein S4 [Priestia taiwanensis]